jgi:hypothetical protein
VKQSTHRWQGSMFCSYYQPVLANRFAINCLLYAQTVSPLS